AGAENEVKVKVEYIHSEHITQDILENKIAHLDGVLVAPGFGERGIEGKIEVIEYVRTHKIPFLGICLGMQMAVIEFARNVLELKDANSTEMNPNTSNPVIDLMVEQKNIAHMGGTLRLGAWDCTIEEGTLAYQVYGPTLIS